MCCQHGLSLPDRTTHFLSLLAENAVSIVSDLHHAQHCRPRLKPWLQVLGGRAGDCLTRRLAYCLLLKSMHLGYLMLKPAAAALLLHAEETRPFLGWCWLVESQPVWPPSYLC